VSSITMESLIKR